MAKKSSIEKNERRRRLAKKFAGKRTRLKAAAQNQSLAMEERFAAQLSQLLGLHGLVIRRQRHQGVHRRVEIGRVDRRAVDHRHHVGRPGHSGGVRRERRELGGDDRDGDERGHEHQDRRRLGCD